MTDASTIAGAQRHDDPTPLAADPAAGTDAGAPGDAVVPATDAAAAVAIAENGQGRPFWARLDNPFTVGLLLTLGGLVALLLGIALTNIATILVYIGLATFAALGLDPVIKWLGRHGVKRGWAIAIIFLTGAIIAIGLLLLVVPTLVQPDQCVRHGLPDDDRQLREVPLLRVAGGDLRHRPHRPHRRGREVLHRPEEHRGDLRRPAQGRRRHRHRRLGRSDRRRPHPLLHRVAPRHQGLAHAVRAGTPARRRACHDRPDHRLGRRVPHGHGHPGVLQLRGGDHPARGPAACPTRCSWACSPSRSRSSR